MHDEHRVVDYGEQGDEVKNLHEHAESDIIVLGAAFLLEAIRTANGEVFVITSIQGYKICHRR